jgi:hypothetical protein
MWQRQSDGFMDDDGAGHDGNADIAHEVIS